MSTVMTVEVSKVEDGKISINFHKVKNGEIEEEDVSRKIVDILKKNLQSFISFEGCLMTSIPSIFPPTSKDNKNIKYNLTDFEKLEV